MIKAAIKTPITMPAIKPVLLDVWWDADDDDDIDEASGTPDATEDVVLVGTDVAARQPDGASGTISDSDVAL